LTPDALETVDALLPERADGVTGTSEGYVAVARRLAPERLTQL
jgi:hypothetical protein